jgi:hypothetical protein
LLKECVHLLLVHLRQRRADVVALAHDRHESLSQVADNAEPNAGGLVSG